MPGRFGACCISTTVGIKILYRRKQFPLKQFKFLPCWLIPSIPWSGLCLTSFCSECVQFLANRHFVLFHPFFPLCCHSSGCVRCCSPLAGSLSCPGGGLHIRWDDELEMLPLQDCPSAAAIRRYLRGGKLLQCTQYSGKKFL